MSLFCTRHFVMVPLKLMYLHFFFEQLFEQFILSIVILFFRI